MYLQLDIALMHTEAKSGEKDILVTPKIKKN